MGVGRLGAAAQLGSTLPTATAYDVATYPALARQARIQGEVRVEVVTDGQGVISAHSVRGHELLSAAAEKNAKTWKFVLHEPAKFMMTYQYKIGDVPKGPSTVSFRSPGIVEVSAPPVEMYAVFGRTKMGTWKVETTTAWGTAEMTMRSTRGPYTLKDIHRESLQGKVVNSDGQEFHIEYGRIDGSEVQFVVPTKLPSSGTDMVFFRGEINGDTMAGTFSNATGTEGRWTAKRMQQEDVPLSDDEQEEDE